ncbi:hypothetical protein ACWFNE_03500 [Cellulomonas sp. NPDC055163]
MQKSLTAPTTSPPATAGPSVTAEPSVPAEASTDGTAVTFTADDVVMTGVLNDTQVAQDSAATLPVTLPSFRNTRSLGFPAWVAADDV